MLDFHIQDAQLAYIRDLSISRSQCSQDTVTQEPPQILLLSTVAVVRCSVVRMVWLQSDPHSLMYQGLTCQLTGLWR